jgi:chemotaxis protein methyltransferase CheR
MTERQTGRLASYLTVGETYFFREKKSFDFLEQIYLPGLIRKRYGAGMHLRIWCAGCATGEEAYSLAIVLLQSLPEIHLWNIKILATDINPDFLEKAKRGIYTKWSFRNTSPEFQNRYFTQIGNKEYQILPEIRNLVQFSSLNLAGDSYPSKVNGTDSFDIIFCRNVMIYFSVEYARIITGRFYQSLVNGGVLMVSPVEMSPMISSEFSKIDYAGFTIYQKGNHKLEKSMEPFPDFTANISLPSVQTPENIPEAGVKIEDQKEFVRLRSLLSIDKPTEPFALTGGSDILAKAKASADEGKLKQAEELCRQGLSIDKLNPAFYYLLATLMQEEGRDAEAIPMLRMALYLDPDFVLADFLYGILCLKAGDRITGLKSFKNAGISLAKLSPDDILPDSDGLSVARFKEILDSITG